jgi:uncharacterized protein (TIGR03437 family)
MKLYAFVALLPHLAAADPAYFQIGDARGDSIVVLITQPASVQKARDILAGRSPAAIMTGKVIPAPSFYNPGWHFHVDPATVAFVDIAAEVCDSAIGGVDQGLNDVGGAFLPGFLWCPWSTRVLAEIPVPADAAQHVVHVSAADYTEEALAPGAVAAAFGPGLIADSSIVLTDSTGGQSTASVVSSGAGQMTYLLPDGLAPGPVTAAITTPDGQQFTDPLYVHAFASSLFAVNLDRLAAAWVTRMRADGSMSAEPVYQLDSQTQTLIPAPIALGPETDQLYLNLLGTGIRNRPSLDSLQIVLGGRRLPVLDAGAVPSLAGVDQIKVLLPHTLGGSATVSVSIASTLPGPRTLASEAVHLVFQ